MASKPATGSSPSMGLHAPPRCIANLSLRDGRFVFPVCCLNHSSNRSLVTNGSAIWNGGTGYRKNACLQKRSSCQPNVCLRINERMAISAAPRDFKAACLIGVIRKRHQLVGAISKSIAPLSRMSKMPCRMAVSIISGGAKAKVNCISRSGEICRVMEVGMSDFARARFARQLPRTSGPGHPISASVRSLRCNRLRYRTDQLMAFANDSDQASRLEISRRCGYGHAFVDAQAYVRLARAPFLQASIFAVARSAIPYGATVCHERTV